MIVLCITILIVLVASSEFTWKLLDDNCLKPDNSLFTVRSHAGGRTVFLEKHSLGIESAYDGEVARIREDEERRGETT